MWVTLNISLSFPLTHTQTRAHAHTHARTHTRVRTHTRTHTHTHTHTHILSNHYFCIHVCNSFYSSKISFTIHTRTLNVTTPFNQCLSHTLVFVLYLLIRIREVLARGLGNGDRRGFASINIFALTSKNRPWPREFKKDIYASLASRAMLYY